MGNFSITSAHNLTNFYISPFIQRQGVRLDLHLDLHGLIVLIPDAGSSF